ncbi:MAG: T9SS type A sorting domain-containing protein [Bacteroidetes bacterium]|nr:T9SS type A sorting domain-containing protein [Bacteroidota bacterium]
MKTTWLVLLTLLLSYTLITPVIAQVNLDSGLVAYYPFSGNANDWSANGNDLAVIGASLTTDKSGNSASAYSFDGLDDYLIKDSILDIASQTAITICAWFYVDAITNPNRWSGITFGKFSTGALWFRTLIDNSTGFQMALVEPSEANGTHIESGTYSYGQWYHLVGVYKDKDVKLYVDAVDQGAFITKNNGGSFANLVNANNFRVGLALATVTDGPQYFDGKIDEVIIYDRALNSSEVQAIYNGATILGIQNPDEADYDIKISPNPISNSSILIFDDANHEFRSLEFYNLAGRKIKEINISNKKTVSIGQSNLVSGLYFYKLIHINGRYQTGKFIVK